MKIRNKSRIYPLLNKIGDYWYNHPDLRFGQIIYNVLNHDDKKDLFYIEDDEFEKLLTKFFKEK